MDRAADCSGDAMTRPIAGAALPREFHVAHSRWQYQQWWRATTNADWRASNARSREKHRKERRKRDNARYWARRILVLMDEAQRRDEWLTDKGYV
jgi:hypothetical protein